MAPRIIYITGFRQHAGKTVTSLGLIHRLTEKYDPKDIGYIKPVGQELVELDDGRKIDKDAKIIEQFTGIPDLDLQMLSPVRLGSGFTKHFLDEGRSPKQIDLIGKQIHRALSSMSAKKVIVAEGTGHPGVGGIVGHSNADVARLMKAEVLFLSGGGIGRALDQLEVDLSYFLYKKVNVRGVIFNKLLVDKIDQVKHYLGEKLLNDMYHFEHPLRVFGYLPEIYDLNKPSMELIKHRFKECECLGETRSDIWQIPISQVRVISLPNEYLNMERYLKPQNVVIIGAGSKNRLKRIIEFNRTQPKLEKKLAGIVLTCGESTDLL
jgi:dethiobiotin synthetase